jgi:hemerythrin-like domain-containing protein
MSKDLKVLISGACQLGNAQTSVTGTKRLAQKFLIELLTETGSMRYLPKRGCHFLPRIRNSAMTESDVIVAFASAALQIERHLRAEEDVRTPHAERYRSSSLKKIIIAKDSLHLEFIVQSRAGNSVRVITPAIPL